MAPKAAPTFKAPDGREFATRAEWRDYMMSEFYSWKDKVDAGVLTKQPGEVDGQVFDIARCSGTTLVVMDSSEAVQIDNLTNCRVFIGCCVSSIFIRNCDSCIFYTCCRQLRLREVTRSSLYVYSQAEVHIEQSTELAFAPFNGGYAEQARDFQKAGLSAEKNLWYDIFDHNDPAKTRTNWRLMDVSEMEPAWFPQGFACTPVVPVTAPGAVQALDAGGKEGNQVGQAFGMEQMMADAERIKAEAVSAAGEKLSMESALLVASALGKGINVSVWLTEGGGVDGKTPASEFNAKLTSLSLVVGVEEDMETKRELEKAISKSSLSNIADVCGRGKDKSTGAVLVDVGFFLAAANAKVAKYLAQADDDEDVPVAAAAAASAAAPSPPRSPTAAAAAAAAAAASPRVDKEQLDIVHIPSDSPTSGRPHSAKHSPLTRIERGFTSTTLAPTAPSTPVLAQLAAAEATETIIPDSPYDEEVAFDLEEEEEADTVLPYGARKSTAPKSFAKRRPQSAPRARSAPSAATSAAGTTAAGGAASRPAHTAKTSSPSPLRAPRPSSAGPTRASPAAGKAAAAGSSSAGAAFSSSQTRMRSLSAGASRASNASSVLRSSLSATATRPVNPQEDAENKVRFAVRHTDLYHLVQVHLGFIDAPYRLVPARGPIVMSKPRPWITVREIQTAFGAAREHFSDAAVAALLLNVAVFAKAKTAASGSGTAGSSAVPQLPEGGEVVVGEGHEALVASAWLKLYLVHLRLTKRPNAWEAATASKDVATAEAAVSPSAAGGPGANATGRGRGRDGPLQWKEWLGTKLVNDEKSRLFKPKEFRRALAGRKHALSKEEIAQMLEAHEIVPADSLKTEISQQVRAWLLDMDGRMDFVHSLNVEKRRYLKEHSLVSWKQLSGEQRLEVDKQLRKKLASEKSASLLASEKTNGAAAITKALFAKFERFNKAQHHDPMLVSPWGTWLAKHQAAAEDGIQKFKVQAAEREKAEQQKRTRSQAVAPLADVEAQLLKAAESLRPDHNMELRKSLVALRRSVLGGGLSSSRRRSGSSSGGGFGSSTGSGSSFGAGGVSAHLVSKRDFEKHLDRVLAPRLQELPESLRGLAAEARRSHEGLPTARGGFATDAASASAAAAAAAAAAGAGTEVAQDDVLFRNDQEQALARGQAIEAEREEKKRADFEQWRALKESAKALAEQEKLKQEEAKTAAQSKKARQAQKAFRTWMRLRKDGKYATVVPADGERTKKVVRTVPEVRRVSHIQRWSKETELPGYTY